MRWSESLARVHGGGFVTREMVERVLDELRGAQRGRTRAILVDLTEVAGYEATCLRPAQQFLREASTLGLSRIALVAPSSIVRTATRLAAPALAVELRTFDFEPHAAQWLEVSQAVAEPRSPSPRTQPSP
ncbi:MAG: STAS/SEC14 domain-containing protein [Deltaproteobacteria bacterium]|nr:STAS/SEC14 domain-containing protein [Deltaproteobacteria bacterium]